MSDWYLYDEDGAHRGPVTTDALVKAIRTGELAEDVWVAPEAWFEPPGASGWRRAGDIPELAKRITVRPPMLIDGAFTTTPRGTPEFGATVMMVVSRSEPSETQS